MNWDDVTERALTALASKEDPDYAAQYADMVKKLSAFGVDLPPTPPDRPLEIAPGVRLWAVGSRPDGTVEVRFGLLLTRRNGRNERETFWKYLSSIQMLSPEAFWVNLGQGIKQARFGVELREELGE